jgi:hypothetical protein
VHGRHLAQRAAVGGQGGIELGGAHGHRTAEQHAALAIGGGGRHAQGQGGTVALVGVQADLRELGGRAEAQRQQAAGQRVERAGVASLLGAQQALGLLQGVVARQAQGLVEQQHAVQGAAFNPRPRGSHWLG